MKQLKFLCIMLAMIMIVAPIVGCGTLTTTTDSVCNNIPEGQTSVICAVADYYNVAPESVAKIIKIGNVAALAGDVYSAKSAMAFLDEMEAFLKESKVNGLTYAAAITAAKAKYEVLPEKTKGVLVILEEFVVAPTAYAGDPLQDYDYTILLMGIEDQRKVIRPFLII